MRGTPVGLDVCRARLGHKLEAKVTSVILTAWVTPLALHDVVEHLVVLARPRPVDCFYVSTPRWSHTRSNALWSRENRSQQKSIRNVLVRTVAAHEGSHDGLRALQKLLDAVVSTIEAGGSPSYSPVRGRSHAEHWRCIESVIVLQESYSRTDHRH